MKIVIAVNAWFADRPGGAERIAYDESRWLARRGHDVHLVCQNLSGTNKPTREYSDGVEILRYAPASPRVPAPVRAFYHVRMASQLVAALPGHADVVHGHSPLQYLGACRGSRMRGGIYTVHSPWAAETQATAMDQVTTTARRLRVYVASRLDGIVERRILSSSDGIIVESNFTRRLLAERYRDPDIDVKTTVIPGSASFDTYEVLQSHESVIRARRKLGWPTDLPVLFTARRMVPRMGLHTLLAALSIVKKQGLPFFVSVAGDGPLRLALESWVQSSDLAGAIRFEGRVPEDTLHTMYSAADAFVLPSQALECFGLIAVESFAAGRPVLATPVGAIPEVVGSICPQWIAEGSDGVALGQLIAQFLAGDLPRISPLDLREAARERWDTDVIMPQVEEVLQKAAARSALRQRFGHA